MVKEAPSDLGEWRPATVKLSDNLDDNKILVLPSDRLDRGSVALLV